MFNIHCWTHIARVSSFIIKISVRKMILQWLDWKFVVCPFSHSFLWLISKQQHNDNNDSNSLHQSFLNLLCARPYAKSFIYIIYLIFTTTLLLLFSRWGNWGIERHDKCSMAYSQKEAELGFKHMWSDLSQKSQPHCTVGSLIPWDFFVLAWWSK